jgi:type VI secretion system secreted protein Hcp
MVPAAAATNTDMQLTATVTEVQPILNYDVYLRLDGITGDSLVKRFEKWIKLTGIQLETANADVVGSRGGGGAGKAELKNFIVMKQSDSASVPLLVSSFNENHIKNGQIAFVTRTGDPKTILSFDLGSIIVANYKFNNATEIITLKMDSIRMNYFQQKSDGSLSAPISGGWDFFKNQVIK